VRVHLTSFRISCEMIWWRISFFSINLACTTICVVELTLDRCLSCSANKLKKKSDYEKFSAYYNMDNGTGKFRGVYLQANSAAASIFRVWLQPFAKMGASTLTLQNTGGTDHLSFDGIGLPGFQFIQDKIEYDTRTHHSNQDNYDRIQPDDMKQNATIMAAFVYQTAMMDDRFPRKESVKP